MPRLVMWWLGGHHKCSGEFIACHKTLPYNLASYSVSCYD